MECSQEAVVRSLILLKWTNSTVQKAKPSARTIRSFKDPSITTGLFVLDLLDAIRSGIVDPALVLPVSGNGDYEGRRQNAKLAISIARKMNALIFLVPEDIVDVRPRLFTSDTTPGEARPLRIDVATGESNDHPT
ncbi:hypothetical protein D9756_009379 [Leucocoprinus leucothites]|uniref:Calponin-homology (CH) domain-containing protein n=1 Tax=Leucocoprinus leucothites TaxID=201217 RepID=A0A8H5FUH3_9AGAR|nr:hypothetical protein D9756_009379 [Leucoagaricus leucothites]